MFNNVVSVSTAQQNESAIHQGTLGVASRVPSSVLYFRMERGTSLDTL